MTIAVIPDDAARVAALHRLGVLDQPPAPDLDGITRLAAFVTGAPVAIINLLDADRQWQASVTGADRGVFPREDSMCQHTVAQDRTVHVPDATQDARFVGNPFVSGELDAVRLYCGVPLHDVGGYAVGTLCVIDPLPRTLSVAQVTALQDLAAQVEHLLELRRQHGHLVDVLAEVDHYATHDALTGCANRRLLVDRLDHALARALRTGLPPLVLFCDLDGFKAVNDSLGHEAGDTVLRAVGERLRSAARPADTVARLGGDEFVVLCEDVPPSARPLVEARVRAVLAQPVAFAGTDVHVGVSIGTAVADGSADAATLLDAADRAMYADKLDRRRALTSVG